MTDQSKDRIEGAFDKLQGRGEGAVGELTDNDQLRDQGDANRLQGEGKQGLADAKDKLDDAVKKVTNG